MNSDTDDYEIADNICYRCRKKVFFNERAPPFLTRNYHAKCFRCESCHKVLCAGLFRDHADDPYCEQCHERLFGGNRKRYAKPDETRMGEVDRTDPLQEIKSDSTGKLDIKRFSEKHNIPTKLKEARTKHQKLHQYMIGTNNETLMMEGRMGYVHNKLRQRLHSMIEHQCQSFQKKLIERVDSILQQEILEYRRGHRDHTTSNEQHLMESINQISRDQCNEIDESTSEDIGTQELIRRLSSNMM